MANILLRNVPEFLYQRLKHAAENSRRTVPAEVLHLVEQSLLQTDMRRNTAEIFERVDRKWQEDQRIYPDATAWIREDRER